MRHNNPVPHTHAHKHWNPCSSQKGHIRTFLHQAKQKQQRNLKRKQRALRIFPRPIKRLQPVVRCPTQRYNWKSRLGRGFSLAELKKAGLHPKYARTIGISVDIRRKNKSEEGLERNAQRLKEYLSRLILFPLNPKKIRAGEATVEQTQNVQQGSGLWGPSPAFGKPQITTRVPHEKPRAPTQEEKDGLAYRDGRRKWRVHKHKVHEKREKTEKPPTKEEGGKKKKGEE
eukprot:TRINITY_DN24_c0_g1_i1.p1 TRINITY_DN24_c0_g1~~TRINITY_DN24_c0_g1_i1.p1  ORF type:complete len:265 (-),score=52.41 TRINITY_DN24_c0_g1_i1:23-709(-)